MIDFYAMGSPNVVKIYIALEELGVPYTVHPVDVFGGKQFDEQFRKLNPMAKVPVIVDQDGPGGKPYTVFESGAILLYLAEKTGKLLPADRAARFDAIQWMMVQMTTVGPMFGQLRAFRALRAGGQRLFDEPLSHAGDARAGGGRGAAEPRAVSRRRRILDRRHRDLPVGAQHPDAARRRRRRRTTRRSPPGWRRSPRGRRSPRRSPRRTRCGARPPASTRPTPQTLDRVFGRGQFAAA